ncbi:hypothetical protein SBADM41S_06169 [Streptomyces badius]
MLPRRVERGVHGPDDGHDGRRVTGGDGRSRSVRPDGPQDVESVAGERRDHSGQGHGPRPETRGELHAACGVPEQTVAGGEFVREQRDAHEARTAQRGAQRLQEPRSSAGEQQGPQLLARQGRRRQSRHPREVGRGGQIADERGVHRLVPARTVRRAGPLGTARQAEPARTGAGHGRGRRVRQTVAYRVRERGQRPRGERRGRRADGDPQPPALRTGGQEHIRTGRRWRVQAVAVLPGDGQRLSALRAQGGEVQIGEEELRGQRQPVGKRGNRPLVRPSFGGLQGEMPQIVLEPGAVPPNRRRTRGSERNGRGERAEHPVYVGQGVVPAAHRETEHQIRPAGGGCECPVVGGEHGGVEGGPGAHGETAQRLHLFGVDREPVRVEERTRRGVRPSVGVRPCAGVRTGGEHGRPVGGTQPRPPVVAGRDPGIRHGGIRGLREADGVVAEGTAQGHLSRHLTPGQDVVHGDQLPHQERGAVTVADDVVGVCHQDVLVGSEGEHPQTQQGPGPGFETACPLGGDALLHLLRVGKRLEVDRQTQRGRQLLLDGRARPGGEDRAQHRVAPDERVHRALEADRVEAAAQAEPGEPGRCRARRDRLGQQETPLGGGQGEGSRRPGTGGGVRGGLNRVGGGRCRVHGGGEGRERAVAVDHGRPGERPALLLQPVEHLQHEQGVAAQDEEVVLAAHVVGLEQRGPDGGEPDLGRRAGRCTGRCRTGR